MMVTARLAPTLALGSVLALAAAAPAPAVTISDGHVDAGSARLTGGKLRAYVKDASSGRVRWRKSSQVTIRVVDRARTRLPRDGSLRFAGRAGQTVWMIPQVQRRGVVWAGWNTEEIRRSQLRGGVRWTLRGVSGPGRVAVWQTGSFGAASVWFGAGRSSRVIAPGVHAHTNWSFTRRGTYRLRFGLSARSAAGRRLRTSQTLRIKVG